MVQRAIEHRVSQQFEHLIPSRPDWVNVKAVTLHLRYEYVMASPSVYTGQGTAQGIISCLVLSPCAYYQAATVTCLDPQ